VKKQQWLLISSAFLAFILLFSFGITVPPHKQPATAVAANAASSPSIRFETLLAKAKEHISPAQAERLTRLENAVVRGDIKDQQIHVYHQLARFWSDSARVFEPYAYYTGEAAKLENSEKSLTFAAHLFLDNLMAETNPAMQNWLATNAKVLLEKALAINPANDSSRIGLGACYMFGNISDNPMQGILPVREIVAKHPDNLYGQMILGLGGKKSGQYDKAIERFKIVVEHQPDNLEAIFHLAECYDLHGEKANAIQWYEVAEKLIRIPEAKAEIDKRILELKK